MSRFLSKFFGLLGSRTLVGVDKAGNRYFIRKEEIDGVMKEKRWVVFKGDTDPTSIPVEWICWLNGQRKVAPTPEELLELEKRRELVKLNVERLKREEEKKSAGGGLQKSKIIGKAASPDLKSFVQQFPRASFGHRKGTETGEFSDVKDDADGKHRSSEPTGSGETFKPGTWQPPT